MQRSREASLGMLGLSAGLMVPILSPESTQRHLEGLSVVARAAEQRT